MDDLREDLREFLPDEETLRSLSEEAINPQSVSVGAIAVGPMETTSDVYDEYRAEMDMLKSGGDGRGFNAGWGKIMRQLGRH